MIVGSDSNSSKWAWFVWFALVVLSACGSDDDRVLEADHDRAAEVELSADEFDEAAPAQASPNASSDAAEAEPTSQGDAEVATEAAVEAELGADRTPGDSQAEEDGLELAVESQDSAETASPVAASGQAIQLCVTALEVEQDDSIGDLTLFDPEYYPALDAIYARLGVSAAVEQRTDITTVRETLSEVGEVLASNDLFSDEVVAAFDALEEPAYLDALTRVDTFLRDVCGVVNTPGNGGDNAAAEFQEDDLDAELVDGNLDETVTLNGPGEVVGTLEPATYDVFEVAVPDGTNLVITMQESEFGDVDPFLRIVSPDGAVIENDQAETTDLGLFDSQVSIPSATAGTYTIEARSFLNRGSGSFTLTVDFG